MRNGARTNQRENLMACFQYMMERIRCFGWAFSIKALHFFYIEVQHLLLIFRDRVAEFGTV
jgi:hypothetical protein